MFNFTLISKKNFLNFLNKVNFILINIFNNLRFSNLKRLTKLFFIDKNNEKESTHTMFQIGEKNFGHNSLLYFP